MVKIEIKPQKDNKGDEIDKIATVTRDIITQKVYSLSGTELTHKKEILQKEIDALNLKMDEYNEISEAMNG